MEKKEIEMIESLLEESEELKVLMEEHQEYERRLMALQEKQYLKPEEEIEKKKLQKLKLAGMDRIAEILAMYKDRSKI